MIADRTLPYRTIIEINGRKDKEFTRMGQVKVLKRKYKVIKSYPHFVLAEDVITGMRRCITNVDLMIMGLVRQG